MEKIKVMTVFGTRPEAVKMAPLDLELRRHPEIEALCCVTAQHREMLDSVLSIFGVTPEYDLNIMSKGQTLTDITTRALSGLGEVFDRVKPDLVLVHGDTSTTFAGALAAFYHNVRVGHVEAGLRSFDKFSPFPEEINRKLTGQIADLHFCPTPQNKENLHREGVTDGIYLTGNTAIDAMRYTAREDYRFSDPTLEALDFSAGRTVLLTAHRRENYGEPFRHIFSAIRRLHDSFPDVQFVYPVHPAPVVRETAQNYLGSLSRVHLIDPLPVDEMHNLMARCTMVMTDSGGLQEEAPAMGKPVLVLRRETERPEAIRAGTVKLAGVEEEAIYTEASRLLSDPAAYDAMAKAVNPYGDGHACPRIVQAILSHFGMGPAPEEFLPRY